MFSIFSILVSSFGSGIEYFWGGGCFFIRGICDVVEIWKRGVE